MSVGDVVGRGAPPVFDSTQKSIRHTICFRHCIHGEIGVVKLRPFLYNESLLYPNTTTFHEDMEAALSPRKKEPRSFLDVRDVACDLDNSLSHSCRMNRMPWLPG